MDSGTAEATMTTTGKTSVALCLEIHMRELGLTEFKTEFYFCGLRAWRFDYALPKLDLAIEIEGGIWVQGGGGHNRGRAFQDDLEKYNTAASLGWTVFRFSCEDILKGKEIPFLEKWLELGYPRLASRTGSELVTNKSQ